MSTAIINLPVINENNQLSTFLAKVKQTMIPLVPEMMNFVKPELKLGFQKIVVDIELHGKKSNRDIYEVDGGKYSLHLSKLNEIAQAAGLRIIDSKQIDRQNDPTDRRISFIKHQMKWELRSIDGSTKSGTVTGEYNYEEDKHRNFTPAQQNKRRNFAGGLAESNCMGRAINKAISKLPQSFTLQELQKPFLVPCVIEDYSEMLKKYPDMEKAYIAQKIGLAGFLMSSPDQLSAKIDKVHGEFSQDTNKKNIQDADFQEAAEEKKPIGAETPAETKKSDIWIDPDMPKDFNPKEWHQIQADTFKEVPQKERTEAIHKLIESRKYKRLNDTPIEQYPIARQIELIFTLRCMQPSRDN